MKIFSACASLLLVLTLAACNLDSDNKSFDSDLQGTWVSNDSSVYSGSLKIENDRITINGYSESQSITDTNYNQRPFRNFIKGIALKGYSQNEKIYIEDGGSMQEGIPYTYWENTSPDNTKFLRFTFDGRIETLQKQE